jgi:hypothetical protein
MDDLDLIIESLPDYNTETVPLQDIFAIPGMTQDSALPYHLYLTMNPKLPEDRKEKIRQIIDRIKFNTDYINRRNLAFLERDFAVAHASESECLSMSTQPEETKK